MAYNSYKELDRSVYPFSYISEVVSKGNITITENLVTGVSVTYTANDITSNGMRNIAYNIIWKDADLQVHAYFKKDLYANADGNITYGAKIVIMDVTL